MAVRAHAEGTSNSIHGMILLLALHCLLCTACSYVLSQQHSHSCCTCCLAKARLPQPMARLAVRNQLMRMQSLGSQQLSPCKAALPPQLLPWVFVTTCLKLKL